MIYLFIIASYALTVVFARWAIRKELIMTGLPVDGFDLFMALCPILNVICAGTSIFAVIGKSDFAYKFFGIKR